MDAAADVKAIIVLRSCSAVYSDNNEKLRVWLMIYLLFKPHPGKRTGTLQPVHRAYTMECVPGQLSKRQHV